MAQVTQFPQRLTTSPQRSAKRSNFFWWLMVLSSGAIAVYGASYFFVKPSDGHFARYILPLRLHIAGGVGALLAGPWQFSQKLRTRALNVHRWLGRF